MIYYQLPILYYIIFEYFITRNSMVREILIKYWFIPKTIWDEGLFNRFSDLGFNMLGYHLGNIRN